MIAGEQQGAIAAQEANIVQLEADLSGTSATQAAELTRLQAEQRNAQAEYDRFERLYQAGGVSASTRDAKRLTLETAQAQVQEAQANQGRLAETIRAQIAAAHSTLDRLREVRPEVVAVAQAEVDRAIQALALARIELSQSEVRAPIAGQVLKIHARAGESVGQNGILELGQTQQMVVVAEVDESHIQYVRSGQTAAITSTAFPETLTGTVAQIGQAVNRQTVVSNQPGNNLDNRVVEVRIRLTPSDSQRVANLTNLQVAAAITVDSQP